MLKKLIFSKKFSSLIKNNEDYYQLTKETKFAGDTYLWERMREYIPKNNIKSHLINELTCFKDDERFEMNK